jgi:hypothetical protein
MDSKTYEINNLRVLNDYLTQTIEVLARVQRMNLSGYGPQGLTHTPFGPTNAFGVPTPQGIGNVDPRSIDYTGVGLAHSPYNYPGMGLSHSPYSYPYGYPGGAFGFGGQPSFPTFVDPFVSQRGLSHTGIPTGVPGAVPVPGQYPGWSPLAVEIQRQRELQAILARQQYEAMWRPFLGV